MTPPIAPMIVANSGDGSAGSAVIATNPAKAPLSAIVRSAFPNTIRATIKAAMSPPEAAALVFKKTFATSLATAIPPSFKVDPPLNPNQPIHKINTPKVANGKFAPGMALTVPEALYFPLRGPKTITPARAAAAPARWTIPEPA